MGSLPPSTTTSSPPLPRLPATTPLSQIESTLLSTGGLILTSLLPASQTTSMLSILNAHFPPSSNDFDYTTPGSFFPHSTKVLWSLVARGDSVGRDVVMHPVLVGLREALLRVRVRRVNDQNSGGGAGGAGGVATKAICGGAGAGSGDVEGSGQGAMREQGMQKVEAEIPPRLSLSVAFDMRPGSTPQPLHRDEDVWGTTHTVPFTRDSIRQIGVLIAGTKCVRENGATLVIPGSHLWGDERVPRVEEAVPAELEVGDALVFLSGTRHGAGANVVSPFLERGSDGAAGDAGAGEGGGEKITKGIPNPLARRVLFGYFFAKGYLRQEENMLISIPRDVVLGMHEDVQRLIGYEASSSHCGFVEFKSPVGGDVHPLGLKGLFERTGRDF